jgi:hypothetical protein
MQGSGVCALLRRRGVSRLSQLPIELQVECRQNLITYGFHAGARKSSDRVRPRAGCGRGVRMGLGKIAVSPGPLAGRCRLQGIEFESLFSDCDVHSVERGSVHCDMACELFPPLTP